MVESTESISVLLQLKQEQFEKNARSAGAAIDRLERKFNPLVAAEAKLEKQTKRFNAALKAGTIDAKQHANGMNLLQREFDQTKAKIEGTTSAMGRMNAANTNSASFMARNRNVFQQAGYQVGDFAVQVQGGTSALTAFTQQGSQMLGVFGAYGAIAGAVLAVGAPIISTFLNSGERAAEYKDALEELTEALAAYQTLAAESLQTSAELAESFGHGGEMARESLTLLRELALVETLKAAQGAAASLASEYENIFSIIDDQNAGYFSEFMVGDVQMTREEVVRLRDALASIDEAQGTAQLGQAMRGINDLLIEMYGGLEDVPPAFQDIIQRAAELDVKILSLNNTVDQTRTNLFEVVDAAYAAAQGFAAAGGPADALLGKVQSLAAAAWDYAGAMGEARAAGAARGPDGAVSDVRGELTPTGLKRSDIALQRTYSTPSRSAAKPARSGGGGGRKSGGGGGSAKEQASIFAATEQDLLNLERQISMVGKSKSEIAGLTAKYKLLDLAKERGLDLDAKQAKTGLTLSQSIDASANSLAQLTEEYERSERSQSEFEAGIDSISEALAGAIVDGENLRESLAGVFKGIASDLLTSGIKEGLLGLFSGGSAAGSSGGGFLSKLLGGGGLFAGLFDQGGNIPSGQFGIAGENGPEIINGPAAVTSTRDTAALMSGGTTEVTVKLDVPEGVTVEETMQISQGVAVQVVAANNQAVSRKQSRR